MEIIKLIYFVLPVAIANMTSSLSRNINFLNVPVDFGKKFHGKRILGKNKTWRGVFFGALAGMIAVLIQTYLYRYDIFKELSIIDYTNLNPILLGFLLGFGDVLGDCVESFFKRRRGIKPGEPFIPFDQIDGVSMALILSYKYHKLPVKEVFKLLVVWFLLAIIVRHISYYIGLNEEKW